MSAHKKIFTLTLIMMLIALGVGRAIFIGFGSMAAGAALLFVLLGVGLFHRLKGSFLKRREDFEQKLRLTQFSVDKAAEGAFWMGQEAQLIYVNEAACRMLGYTREELLSLRWHDLDLDFTEETWTGLWKEIKKNRTFPMETVLRRKGGNIFPAEVRVNYLEFEGREYNCAFVRDITKQKQLDQALRKGRAHYRGLFENSPISLWEEDFSRVKDYLDNLRRKGIRDIRSYFEKHPEAILKGVSLVKVLDVNRATLELLKAESKEELYEKLPTLFQSSREAFREELISLFEGRLRFQGEISAPDLKGGRIVCLIEFSVSPGHEETWSRVLLSLLDITDRKKAEREIRDLAKFPSENPNPVLRIARNGEIIFANRASRPLLRHWRCRAGGNLPAPWKDKIDAVFQSGSSEDAAVEYEGRTIHLTFSRPSKGSRFVNMYGLDITSRKQAERAFQENETRLKTILDNIAEGVIAINELGLIESFNKASEKMFAYTEEEVIGHNAAILEPVSGAEGGFFQHSLKNFEKKTKGIACEIVGRRKNGETFPLELDINEARLGERRIFTGIVRDVSKRKEMEAELARKRDHLERTVAARTRELRHSLGRLKDANLRLEEANRHRSRFISSMSHELRTPLNAILGFADLLFGQYFGTLNEKQLSYLVQIQSGGQHLLDLINDLLDLAKIDAGAMEVERESFSIKEIIHPTVSMMNSQFRKKGQKVEIFLDPALGVINADRRKCKQIILNLLSNACKYSPEGGLIEVRARKENESQARIEICDHGIGIEEEEREKIFSEFHQADQVRDEQLGGTGIGLALTKRLVEMHEGAIGVESEVGEGSVFWFTLPLKNGFAGKVEEEEEKESKEELPNASRKRILVVEDNENNLAMILDMLKIHDHKVAIARNGRAGIEMATSFKPELILMDIQLPVMNGLEATRRLRAMPEFAQTPIIALTADTGAEAEALQVGAGCSEHLPKPVQSRQLFAVLQRCLVNPKENSGNPSNH